MQTRILFLLLFCCFLIEALIPRTSPSISTPVPPITTLPPAHPGTPDRNPCDFVDRDELLSRVVYEWQGYNVSLLVETCPDVCVLIYGSGNPDVSGIGVWVCYIVQFISTLILGPLLLTLAVLEDFFSARFNRIRRMVEVDIAPSITSGNRITLSIMIASFARLAQKPPIFEINFINVLLWLQVLMIAGRGYWALALSVRTAPDHQDIEERHIPSLVAFLLAIPAFFTIMVVTTRGVFDRSSYRALVAISQFCRLNIDLPVPVPPPEPPKNDSSGLTWWQNILLIISMAAAMALLLLMMLGIVILRDVLWEKLSKDRQQQLLKIYKQARAFFIAFLWLIPGVLWLMLGIWALATLQGYRNALKMGLGEQYQDSFWGFGQVAIVVMLLPNVSEVVKPLILGRWTKQKGKAKTHELEPLMRSSRDADDDARNIGDTSAPSVRLGNEDHDEEALLNRSTNQATGGT